MRSLLFIICVLSFFSCQKNDSDFKDIAPYISAWQVKDVSQTQRAEKTYYSLKDSRKNPKLFKDVLSKLYKYLAKHPNERLSCRILMYDVLISENLGEDRQVAKVTAKITEAIKLAHQLDDKQLLSEVYALAGQVNYEGGLLIYNLKAVELQRNIAFQYFSHLQIRLFNISWSLYSVNDFNNSIAFGLEGLNLKKKGGDKWDKKNYIFQLDIVGASYKALKNYDKALYYYQLLLNCLSNNNDDYNVAKDLWIGIAKGNIGHILALQNKTAAAMPLITEHLENSLALGYFDNAAMAQNNLANIYLNQKLYTKAISGFKNAYQWATNSDKIKEQLNATKGIASAYQLTRQADSAFKYYNLYHQYRDVINQENAANQLSSINAKIAFDDAQNNLNIAKNIIDKQRLTRNFILAAILLLTIIAILFYNKKMLQQKYIAKKLALDHQISIQEANQAKNQVASFRTKIVRNEQLINNLKKQIDINNKELNNNLLQYTLFTDDEWSKFRTEFLKAYPKFFLNLSSKQPTINPSEERLATLLFLKLSPDQIAQTLGISKDSVARSKRRLKQKLQLQSDTELENLINQLA